MAVLVYFTISLITAGLLLVCGQSPTVRFLRETAGERTCPGVTVASYRCSGLGSFLRWYAPPLLNRDQALLYTNSDTPGTMYTEGVITTNLISVSNGVMVSELTLSDPTSADLTVFCGTGINFIAFNDIQIEHTLSRSSPLPDDSVSNQPMPGGVDIGVVEISWPAASGMFDIESYLVDFYVDNTLLKNVTVHASTTALTISFNRTSGSRTYANVSVVTECNQISPAVQSNIVEYPFIDMQPCSCFDCLTPIIVLAVIAGLLAIVSIFLAIYSVYKKCYKPGEVNPNSVTNKQNFEMNEPNLKESLDDK